MLEILIIFFSVKPADEYPYDPRYNIYPVDNKKILTLANDYVECLTSPTELRMFDKLVKSKREIYRIISKLPNIDKSAITKEDTGFIDPGPPPRLTKAQIDSFHHDKMMEMLKKKQQPTLNKPGADSAIITAAKTKTGHTIMAPALKAKTATTSKLKDLSDVAYIYYNDTTYEDGAIIYVTYDCNNSNSDKIKLEASWWLPDGRDESYPMTFSWRLSNWDVIQFDDQADNENETFILYQPGQSLVGVDETFRPLNADADTTITCICYLDISSSTVINSVAVSPPDSITMNAGDTKDFTATVDPSCAYEVTWSSSDSTIADVNSNGEVTAKVAGKATIYATSTFDQSKYGSCSITVKPVITNIISASINDLSAGIMQKITIQGNGFAGDSDYSFPNNYVIFSSAMMALVRLFMTKLSVIIRVPLQISAGPILK